MIYLIPVPLADVAHETCLPEYNRQLLSQLRHFIVENVRSARRFLKAADRSIDIDACTFYELNKHTPAEELARYLEPALRGEDMGIISEAGCPAIADPGADVVALAQRKGLRVVPLVGPSSILMALMGSGFNGQRFAFRVSCPSRRPSVAVRCTSWSSACAPQGRRRSSSRPPTAMCSWWSS